MFRHRSPSFVVSLAALVIVLGGVGYSATGGNFILGVPNAATSQTRLVASINGAAVRIDNPSTGAAALGLNIVTDATRPPLRVTSTAKVDRLNVDFLDGLSSENFPRKETVTFNLAPGGISAPIPLPEFIPISLTGVVTTLGVRGVGHASLLRVPGSFIEWTGLESTAGSVITQGFSGTTGAHILFIDFAHDVDVEVSGPDAIRIHNTAGASRQGSITLIY
jgi:hypothetical protein